MRRLHFLIRGRLLMTDNPKNWTIQKVRELVQHLKVKLSTTDIEVVLK